VIQSTPVAPGANETTTPTTTATLESEQEVFQYTVQPGDTLLAIAVRFGTTVDALRELNTLSGDDLAIGQPLYVPYVEGMTAAGLPTPTPGPFYYTIQSGDTLSGIAARFGVGVIQIQESNSLIDANNLVPGQQILIPGYTEPVTEATTADGSATAATTAATTPAAPAAGDPVIHIVQPGEGLIEIAEIYGVSAGDIAAANNIANRNVLRVGQELLIPGVTARDAVVARGTVHIVQSGESLLGISLRYGVTVEEILDLNEIDNPDAIFVGQELIIPGQ
jgi:LysM repeat protein